MKKIRIIALSLALFSLTSFSASAHNEPGEFDELRHKIANKISFPENDHIGEVTARFTITEEGEVDIIDVRSWNDVLEVYVTEKLAEMKFKGTTIDPRELFIMKFVFKKES